MGDVSELEKAPKMDVSKTPNHETKSGDPEANKNLEPELDVEMIKKKATSMFLQGKRSIYIRDYQAALAALSESCQLFSQIYPETSDELADPYFYYGKALLEVGRNESDVLGDQVQNEDEDDDDDDDDDDDVNDDNDDDADGNNEEDKNIKKSSEKDQEKNSKENIEPERNGDSSSKTTSQFQEKEKTGEEPHKDEAESKNNAEDENGEVNDLQLSWEYLELAKLIYLKKSDTCKATAIKLAETYLCLGENGLESENYSMAIEDIKQALELQKMHLKEEDRRIAETYYQLGVAHSLDQNYDEAIESFKNAIEQLEKKISSLEMRKKIGDKKTEDEERDCFYTMDGEINEIKTVIKDIEEKIKDMKESKSKVKAELLKQVYGSGQSSESSTTDNRAGTSSIPATDISHLVKRKRKNEDNVVGEEKKLKTEN